MNRFAYRDAGEGHEQGAEALRFVQSFLQVFLWGKGVTVNVL